MSRLQIPRVFCLAQGESCMAMDGFRVARGMLNSTAFYPLYELYYRVSETCSYWELLLSPGLVSGALRSN